MFMGKFCDDVMRIIERDKDKIPSIEEEIKLVIQYKRLEIDEKETSVLLLTHNPLFSNLFKKEIVSLKADILVCEKALKNLRENEKEKKNGKH